jgi:hypothetical protein
MSVKNENTNEELQSNEFNTPKLSKFLMKTMDMLKVRSQTLIFRKMSLKALLRGMMKENEF